MDYRKNYSNTFNKCNKIMTLPTTLPHFLTLFCQKVEKFPLLPTITHTVYHHDHVRNWLQSEKIGENQIVKSFLIRRIRMKRSFWHTSKTSSKANGRSQKKEEKSGGGKWEVLAIGR
jgi:hypothetical protein